MVRRSDQLIWSDPENGFKRRVVSPPSGQLKMEVIECILDPHQRITYDSPAFPGHEHHLILIEGMLKLTIDNIRYELLRGDCLRYRLNATSAFETSDQPAHYIITMS